MIYFFAKQSIQKGLAGGFRATAMRLDRDEHRVDFLQLFRIIEAHHPAVIGFVIEIKNPQALRSTLRALSHLLASPNLKSIYVLHSGIKIERVKNE